MDLICTKSMTYSTRRLMPGDAFTASRRDARLLVAIGKAKENEIRAVVPPAPAGIVKDDLTDLRDEAEAAGIIVDKRWGAARLKSEIARNV